MLKPRGPVSGSVFCACKWERQQHVSCVGPSWLQERAVGGPCPSWQLPRGAVPVRQQPWGQQEGLDTQPPEQQVVHQGGSQHVEVTRCRFHQLITCTSNDQLLRCQCPAMSLSGKFSQLAASWTPVPCSAVQHHSQWQPPALLISFKLSGAEWLRSGAPRSCILKPGAH